jgi:hypothetical protein
MTQTPKALRIANAEYRIQVLERDLAAANERAERYREALDGAVGALEHEMDTRRCTPKALRNLNAARAALQQPQETET